jgi:hypothetical protein
VRVIRYPLSHPQDDRVHTLDVPGYRQTQLHTCGFVAGLMVLHYFDPTRSARLFYRRTQPTLDEGTPVPRLVRALRESYIQVEDRTDLNFERIVKSIRQGRPVITTVKRRFDTGHWVVIYGVGFRPNRVFVAGNGIPYLLDRSEMAWADFRKNWFVIGEGLVCRRLPRRPKQGTSPGQSNDR